LSLSTQPIKTRRNALLRAARRGFNEREQVSRHVVIRHRDIVSAGVIEWLHSGLEVVTQRC
jgi:hypothetical protein